ncbi:hypothetical protein MRBBS_0729 [Marinobacter sp. BSs20148]|nr:hypothetical protein MRBBS_0729 [Marinobacter sp. BSs20148]
MIALALGLVLTLGVTQVFLGSNKTYRTNDAIGFLQENLRFSMSRISRDARMAGYYGCLIGEPTEHLNISSADYKSELYDFDRAVIGWEAPDTGLGKEYEIVGLSAGSGGWTNGSSDTLPAVISNNAIPGSDILVLSGTARADVVLDGNPSPPANTISTKDDSGIEQDRVVLVVMGDCTGADRFQKTNAPNSKTITKGVSNKPGNTNATDLLVHTDESQVYRYRTTGYFVGVGVGGEPALFQVPLEPGVANTPVELVSGVESMQVLYGLKAPAARAAERYVPASSVADWSDVVSVRVAMLMRSDDQILEEDNAQTFNLVGTEIDPGADRRARLVATSTTGIRNRLE